MTASLRPRAHHHLAVISSSPSPCAPPVPQAGSPASAATMGIVPQSSLRPCPHGWPQPRTSLHPAHSPSCRSLHSTCQNFSSSIPLKPGGSKYKCAGTSEPAGRHKNASGGQMWLDHSSHMLSCAACTVHCSARTCPSLVTRAPSVPMSAVQSTNTTQAGNT